MNLIMIGVETIRVLLNVQRGRRKPGEVGPVRGDFHKCQFREDEIDVVRVEEGPPVFEDGKISAGTVDDCRFGSRRQSNRALLLPRWLLSPNHPAKPWPISRP